MKRRWLYLLRIVFETRTVLQRRQKAEVLRAIRHDRDTHTDPTRRAFQHRWAQNYRDLAPRPKYAR